MKTINFRGITESLSDGEMKLVKGGLEYFMIDPGAQLVGSDDSDCNKMKLGDDCTRNGNKGCCAAAPFAGYICKVPC